ncbi:helix-turn-helix domain-containing protein [Nocardia sp. NPDC004711]
MVTVEVDLVRVETRLVAGEIRCPACVVGVLARWGWARPRRVGPVGERVRPRRARCRGCGVTHVLLPVTLLLRRAYGAAVIWAVLAARAGGLGHRRIAVRLGLVAATVRGWLRRAAGRLEAVRAEVVGLGVSAGVDVRVPKATGSVWADVVTAIEWAASVIGDRFVDLGVVTPAGVAVAATGGRLLAPGWPPGSGRAASNTSCP